MVMRIFLSLINDSDHFVDGIKLGTLQTIHIQFSANQLFYNKTVKILGQGTSHSLKK